MVGKPLPDEPLHRSIEVVQCFANVAHLTYTRPKAITIAHMRLNAALVWQGDACYVMLKLRQIAQVARPLLA